MCVCVHVRMCLSVCVIVNVGMLYTYIYTVLVLFAECHELLVVDNSDNVQCHMLMIFFFLGGM